MSGKNFRKRSSAGALEQTVEIIPLRRDGSPTRWIRVHIWEIFTADLKITMHTFPIITIGFVVANFCTYR